MAKRKRDPVFDITVCPADGDRTPVKVECDGGVCWDGNGVGSRSEIGGPWAWCSVNAAGEMIEHGSGMLEAGGERWPTVTNNNTELYAILQAIGRLPHGWSGEVWTDSWVTIRRLQRLIAGRGAEIAGEHERTLLEATRALRRLGRIKLVHVKGHATVEDLKAGFYSGDRGKRHKRRTSKFNAWCDEECGRLIAGRLGDTEEGAAQQVGPGPDADAGADNGLREVPEAPGDGQGAPAQEGPDRLEDGGGPAGVPDGGEAVPAVPRGPGRARRAGRPRADVPDHNPDSGQPAGEQLPVGVQAADAPAAVVGPGVGVQRAKARKIAAKLVAGASEIRLEVCPYCGTEVPSAALHTLVCEKIHGEGGGNGY